MTQTWDDIALQFGTDKASSHHGYMGAYEALLGGRTITALLELGVAGGRSLGLWQAVLPFALVVGVDNQMQCLAHQRVGRPVVYADAANPAAMAAVSTLYGPFDVVIDDGSHDLDDVRMAFEELYPRLRDGGVYIVEDLDLNDPAVQAYFDHWPAEFVLCEDRLTASIAPGLIVVER